MMTRYWTLWGLATLAVGGCGDALPAIPLATKAAVRAERPSEAVHAGQDIFRFETFGDESFWSDTLRMHEVIAASVSPAIALGVGLKVDVDALPAELRAGLLAGTVDLNAPATTVALLKLNAVVGLAGHVNSAGRLVSVGTTCALCHSTVDNSFAPGIGHRLDGWPNLDLNPGAIIALSPALTEAQRAVYSSWGPGRYDPRYNLDGINGPVVIPPAYGLKGVRSVTYTGDGADLAYWNRYVAVTQMHGHGAFEEPRTGVRVINPPDRVTDKLAALESYQLGLKAPRPDRDSYDPRAASRGRDIFGGQGRCARCHSGPNFTDANMRLHPASDVVSEPEPNGGPSYASRSASKMYRTTPLRALALRGPYFHNGIAATLEDVVELYDSRWTLNLTVEQKADLVQYLKSR